MSYNRFLIILGLLGSVYSGLAQSTLEAVVPAGDTFSNGSITINWTLGEVVSGSVENSDFQVSQGIHQIQYVITALDLEPQTLNVKVYPNPSTDYITVETFHLDINSIKIYNNQGSLLLERYPSDPNKSEVFDLNSFKDGNYILEGTGMNQPSRTFRIVKTSGL